MAFQANNVGAPLRCTKYEVSGVVNTRYVKPLSVDEYLAFEEQSESRHECVGGHLLELPGSNERRSLIKNAVCDVLRAHLRGSACRVYSTAMKVRVGDIFYYPDVVVSDVPFSPDAVYLTAPLLIVEVACESSESRDMLEKRVAYQALPSLREYVVLFDREKRVVVFRRVPDGWEQETCLARDVCGMTSIGLVVPIEELYRDVPDVAKAPDDLEPR